MIPEPRRASLRIIRNPRGGEEIDRGIVLFYAGPSSFTGEDVVEILLHGGRAVVASVLAALQHLGCRLAEPGEFALRAFEHGKIDLTEAEGIADLIDAETEAQRRQAVAQAGGVLSRLYEAWRGDLLQAMALTEAAIDFSDEADVADDALARACEIVLTLEGRIAAHLADGRRGEILRDGLRVVLAGPPNVGKSSLLNALARRDAAIVSEEAGTTRDVIEVRLDLDGYPVVVSDTAGIREAIGEVEREGIRRTIAHGRAADLVIWITEATGLDRKVPDEIVESGVTIVRVVNKIDLLGGGDVPGSDDDGIADRAFAVSVRSGEGLAALIGMISDFARERIAPIDAPVITQARHRRALQDCLSCLQGYLALDVKLPEIGAEALRRGARDLGRITGRVDAEEVLGVIFSLFCIGK